MTARRKLALGLGLVLAIGLAVLFLRRPFPSDQTPEGAYMRVARAVVEDKIEDAFP